MNNTWKVLTASVPGRGHIIKDIPCQDASVAVANPRPALLVCDGRGSAKYSHLGAQAAIRAFAGLCYNIEPLLVKALDEADRVSWEELARIFYRSLANAQSCLADEYRTDRREFDFTANLAVAGRSRIGFMQIGDGAIVVSEGGATRTLFSMDKGEFANQTEFIRLDGETGSFHQAALDANTVEAVAITTDGPQFLMFDQKDMTPGPVFGSILSDVRNEDFERQDILDYLTRKCWDNDSRGHDDRSLGIMTRIGNIKQNSLPPDEELPVEHAAVKAEIPEEITVNYNPAEQKHIITENLKQENNSGMAVPEKPESGVNKKKGQKKIPADSISLLLILLIVVLTILAVTAGLQGKLNSFAVIIPQTAAAGGRQISSDLKGENHEQK
ncbi:MAG: PP2C family serine/threonine-protein phosphatase [Lentisphaerota bacterium]